jgi:hypothetical protein
MIQLALREMIPIPPRGYHGGGCCHPPGAGCRALVTIFAVAVRDWPPIAVGHMVTIAVHRPLLLFLLHHRCRRHRLTIDDAGDAIAAWGTSLAPPASTAIVVATRRHRLVDCVETLHPCHVGWSGIQYCGLLSPSASPCHPVSVSAGVSVPDLPPCCPTLPDPPVFRVHPPSPSPPLLPPPG